MKKFFALALFLSFAAPVLAADDATTTQAKEDYRAYVQELKRLGAQYRQITGQMKQVIAEEGVPTWSDDKGIVMTKPDFSGAAAVPAGTSGVKETEKDMTVTFDLPGLDRSALKVSLENQSTLHVTGRRKTTGETVDRIIQLPAPAESAKASYEDGVLSVNLKKTKITAVDVPVR
jgi:hypothetical protein